MKRSTFAAVLVLVAGLIAGCASGPRMIRAEQELKPGPDAALIVFMANPNFPFGDQFQLWDREKFIGFIEPLTSVSYRAKPGEHLFMVHGENWEAVKGKVSAGKTYHILVEPRVGVGIYTSGVRVNLSVVDPNDKKIKEWMPRLRPIQIDDPAKAEAVEKKNERNVKKAIGNYDSGKANYITISPKQGK